MTKPDGNTPVEDARKEKDLFSTSDQWLMCILDALGYEVMKVEACFDPNFRLTYRFKSNDEVAEIFDRYIRTQPIEVDAHKLVGAFDNLKKNLRIHQQR